VASNTAGKKFDTTHFIFVILLSLWGLVILYPFYNAVLISIVPQAVYIRTPFLLYPPKIDLTAYWFVFQWKSLLWGARTTIIVLIFGTLYNVMLTISTAYALNKPIPGRKFFSMFIIFTMYFSGGLIPFYLVVRSLGLVNSYFSMILPTGINIMYMLIMQSYFRTIPPDLEESARIDGANDFTVLFRIILPLCLPMLATITLYYGVERWNEWYLGMLFIRKPLMMPLQLFIRNMLMAANIISDSIPESQRLSVFPLGIQMATIIITMLPIICVYPFLQKYFVKGLVLGAVKT
jgi:putative aldouronate transport system permease protein